MLKQIYKLTQNSAIYAISTIIQKLPGLILLPIYTNTHYISSRSEFSDYVLISTFSAFMYFFYTYGMDSALMRYFFLGDRDRKTVFTSTFSILLISSIVTTLGLLLVSPFLARHLLKSAADYTHFIHLAALTLFFDTIGNLPYLILRAEEKAFRFTMFRALRFLLELLFNIFFVVILKTGVIGILYTNLAVSVINFLVMLPVMIRYLTPRIDVRLWKEMLQFGLPFLPNGIAFTIIEMIDRFIVPAMLGKDILGLYGANYRFGALLSMVVLAFRNAWQPFFLKISKQSDAKQIYARVLTYFLIGAGFIVITGTFFIRDILTHRFLGAFYFLGESYWSGISLIPIILLSYYFHGVYVILTPGFYIMKKSKYMLLFTGSAALVNILANLILLPIIGIWGAAFATLLSYITMAATIYLVSNRIYPIPIEWNRFIKIFILLFLLIGIYYIFNLSFWTRIILSVGTILYFGYGVLHREERRGIYRQISKYVH